MEFYLMRGRDDLCQMFPVITQSSSLSGQNLHLRVPESPLYPLYLPTLHDYVNKKHSEMSQIFPGLRNLIRCLSSRVADVKTKCFIAH